jgi:hypothetical protein
MKTPSLATVFANAMSAAAKAKSVEEYPLVRYQKDPVRYCEERLGFSPMPHQRAILESMASGVAGKSKDRVAVRSGQKCGKTKIAISAGLWFYECFEGARVFMCAAIIEQTKAVLWRELGQTMREAKKVCGVEIDGKLAQSPMGGLVSSDGSREIKGISGREIEAVAGLSGRMLTIIDEASALPEDKSEAFHGNTMGGGSLLLISNPTRTSGPFYEAFTKHKSFWQTFHIDSEKVAKWQAETGITVPYVASLERIDEFRAMFGEDSPFWQVRVKGDWLQYETGRCIPMTAIDAALARWHVADEDGPLSIGYDPAGPGKAGDEHAWSVVRGSKCLAIFRRRGLNEDAAVKETLSLLKMYRKPGEIPRVVIDAEGPIGSAIYGRLRGEREHRTFHDVMNRFEVSGVKSSSRDVKEKEKFFMVRDELIWNLAEWIATGSIPNDHKLQAELYEPTWHGTKGPQIFATEKSKLRDALGRSPDSFDALALAVFHTSPIVGDVFREETPSVRRMDPYATTRPSAATTMDPYAAEANWRDDT